MSVHEGKAGEPGRSAAITPHQAGSSSDTSRADGDVRGGQGALEQPPFISGIETAKSF